MTRVDWKRARPILARLLELPPGEREGYLSEACAGDVALADTVRRLLDEEEANGSFLASPFEPSPEGAGRGPSALRASAKIGPWVLLRPLGAGGMGEVWLAQRSDGEYEQRVALKLVHRALHTDELLRRFRSERQILAWLEHPGIARLVDGGLADGRPYLAMEYVDGEPIDHYCEQRGLSTRERIEIFLGASDAVQHAHERGIVHRDLKPTNMLVDSRGRPRLLDFGIAKVLGAEDEAELSDLTRTGQRLYSPLYASPEQVSGEPVTASSDVYCLGVVLCELLTGQRPYDARTTSQLELERIVCQERPRRPSELAPAERRSALRGDLDWIVGMAVRKEPERRYASVQALAADLRRHLALEPVLARPDSLSYRALTFANRHRGPVAGALLALLALTAGLVLSLAAWRDAAAAELESRHRAYSASLQAAEVALRAGDVGLAAARLGASPDALRGWEYRHLSARLDHSLLSLDFPGAFSLAVSPDGSWFVATSSIDLLTCALPSGEVLDRRRISGISQGSSAETGFAPWTSGDIHPNGELLATPGRDGSVRVLKATGLELVTEVQLSPRHVYSAVYDPTGRWLACGLRSGEIVVLEHPGYESVARWQAHGEGDLELTFGAHGTLLASASWDEHVRVWSVPTFEPVVDLVGHEMQVTDLAFDERGERLVSTSLDGTARVWDLAAPTQPAIFRPHDAAVQSVALHPDGESVFTGGGDGTIVRWNLTDGRVRSILRGHTGKVLALRVAGSRLVSAGWCIRFFDLEADDVATLAGCEYQKYFALHPRGSELVVCGADGRKRRWSLPGLQPLPEFFASEEGSGPLAYLADGKGLYVAGHNPGDYELWNLAGNLIRSGTRRTDKPTRASWLDHGRQTTCLLTAERQLEFHPWTEGEIKTVRLAATHGVGIDPAQLFAYGQVDPRGDYLLGSPSGAVWRIDPQDGSVELAFEDGPEAEVLDAQGDDLLVSWKNGISLWNGTTRAWRQERLESRPVCASLHPDEGRIAVGMESGAIHLLDARTGSIIVTLDGHRARVGTVEFSPDGGTLVSCSADGTARVWTAPPSIELPEDDLLQGE